MKKKIPFLVFSGVLLVTSLIQSGCNHSTRELVFEQDQKLYFIDKESATVSVYTQEGKLSQLIGTPGAGTSPEVKSLPPAILHYLLISKGSISGLLWNDLNGNRLFDAGEYGVQNVRVFIDHDNSATYNSGDPSKLTDANGLYTFPSVKAGTMNIHIDTSTLPNGYGFTTSHPISLNLAVKQVITDADFGIQDQSGKINGNIWDQTDNVPVPGVAVYTDLNNNDEYTAGEPYGTTDSSGNYLISGLTGGTFKIHVDNGSLNVKYHRTPVSGSNPTSVTLITGGSLTVDFTYVHKATISGILWDTSGSTWGSIWLFIDLNGNGVYDEGEPITRSNEIGYFIFNELFPGTYTVMILPGQFGGYDLLASPGIITIVEGDNFTIADFLTQALPGTIASYVWDDANGNGKREPEENGLAGVTVFLDTNYNGYLDANEVSTVTDATGAYSFTGLKHGFYYIRPADTSLRSAYIPTTVPNPVYKEIAPGQTYEGAQFGYQSKLAPVHTMQYPTRLTWGSDDNLYVSDNTNNSVFIYNSNLNVLGELKRLDKPLGVTTDGVGNIYVGNQGRKNVEVYDSEGNFIRSFGDSIIQKPTDIVIDRNNNIYVLDSANDIVLVYDQDGTHISAIGNSLYFDYAVSLAINYRDDGTGTEIGELYVADQGKCTIHIFALDGTYKRSAGSSGSLMTSFWDGKFSGLMAVDIDQYGYIHGLDNNLNVVQVFNPQNGAFVRSYNAYPVGNQMILNLQTDISIHPANNSVVMSNVATKSVETIATVPAP